MPSVLTDIYATIAAQAITVNGQAVDVLDLGALPNAVESATLPVRLLQPFNARGEGALQSFWTPGRGVRTIIWGIADLLLWRTSAAGIGLLDIAPDLIAYKVQYADLLSELRDAPQSRWSVTNCTMEVQTFDYPIDGGRWYDGVICQLQITEII